MDEQLSFANMDVGKSDGSLSTDELLPADHRARMIWQVVTTLDLARFEARVVARGSKPGRAATDPCILAALWLYAVIEGVGSGREIARLCDCHDGIADWPAA